MCKFVPVRGPEIVPVTAPFVEDELLQEQSSKTMMPSRAPDQTGAGRHPWTTGLKPILRNFSFTAWLALCQNQHQKNLVLLLLEHMMGARPHVQISPMDTLVVAASTYSLQKKHTLIVVIVGCLPVCVCDGVCVLVTSPGCFLPLQQSSSSSSSRSDAFSHVSAVVQIPAFPKEEKQAERRAGGVQHNLD